MLRAELFQHQHQQPTPPLRRRFHFQHLLAHADHADFAADGEVVAYHVASWGDTEKYAAEAARTGKDARGRGITTGRVTSRVSGAPEVFGELPMTVLAEEIETPGPGQVRALITVASNPVLSAPNGPRLARALELKVFEDRRDSIQLTSLVSTVVDPGVSTYVGPRRQWERSTAAHNTVCLNGHDHSEVWGSFRAGALARSASPTVSTHGGVTRIEAWLQPAATGFTRRRPPTITRSVASDQTCPPPSMR